MSFDAYYNNTEVEGGAEDDTLANRLRAQKRLADDRTKGSGWDGQVVAVLCHTSDIRKREKVLKSSWGRLDDPILLVGVAPRRKSCRCVWRSMELKG